MILHHVVKVRGSSPPLGQKAFQWKLEALTKIMTKRINLETMARGRDAWKTLCAKKGPPLNLRSSASIVVYVD